MVINNHIKILLFLFLGQCSHVYASGDSVMAIKIITLPPNIAYPEGLDCEEFSSMYHNPDGFATLEDNFQQKKIISSIKAAKLDHSLLAMDVNVKVYIFYQSECIDSLCMGSDTLFYLNNKRMRFQNLDLVNMVDSIRQTRAPVLMHDTDGHVIEK